LNEKYCNNVGLIVSHYGAIVKNVRKRRKSLNEKNSFNWLGARIAQSVYRWAADWTARVRILLGARDFYLFHSVQTGSEAHPTLIQSVPGALTPRA
jgi:hypothetical protein